jgi:hypothetical protein
MSELIDQYETGIQSLQAAVRGLSRQQMDWTPPKDAGVGLWTIHQILIHLQDAESALADRVRRVIAEDNPTLQAWNETKFVERLHYEAQSAEDAIQLITLIRRQLTSVLREVSAADLQRVGQHSEAGRQTAAEIVAKAVSHLEHHIKFIHAKRAKMEAKK